MDFKEKLVHFRKENNLTQQQLANNLNIARSTLAEIERGKIKGTINFIQKLCFATATNIEYWIDGNPNSILSKSKIEDSSNNEFPHLKNAIGLLQKAGLLDSYNAFSDDVKQIILSAAIEDITIIISDDKERQKH
jgi:transcriptional regulator with XRE-family HTH domain